MGDLSRLNKELQNFGDGSKSGVWVTRADPSNKSKEGLRHLIGTIKGPSDSVYEKGKFKIEINVSSSYPFEPPKMKFKTKVWHPNISSQTGVICLDILKDQWSPALTIKTALLSLQALLSCPEPRDPQDAVVAEQYLKRREEFDKTAREWTLKFATSAAYDAKVEKIAQMGFDKAKILQVLEEVDGDEDLALERLLS